MVSDELAILKKSVEEEEAIPKYYQKLTEIPEYYLETVTKMVTKGIIKGDEKGNLNLSEDMCRMLVFMDRFMNN